MDNSNRKNMNNFWHKLPTFEQAACAVDNRAIINDYMPEQAAWAADLTSGLRSGWFNKWSDIAIDEQSIGDFFTHLEHSQPSLMIPGTERATESNLGYLSAKFLSSTSVPDDQLLRGTRSSPIIIPDSPDRDNSLDQGERCQTQSCHRRKRAREPESEVEIMFSNPHNMKKAKRLHDSQRNESQLPSIQNDIESKKFVAGWDGVEYVNGRMLIPLGRDLLLEELLSTTTVQGNVDHVSRELGPVPLPYSHKGFIEIF